MRDAQHGMVWRTAVSVLPKRDFVALCVVVDAGVCAEGVEGGGEGGDVEAEAALERPLEAGRWVPRAPVDGAGAEPGGGARLADGDEAARLALGVSGGGGGRGVVECG